MPSNKLALLRYLQIDKMLRSKTKKFPSKDEILEACSELYGIVSPSTIEKDLNAMRLEFEAPIEYSRKEKGYYYNDETFKFLNVNLSSEHLEALKFVEFFLEEFNQIPIFEDFSDAVDKVLDGLEITKNVKKENYDSSHKFIQFDKTSYLKGSQLLSKLINHISNRDVLKFTYKKFSTKEVKSYLIHPFLLKEYNHFWYLIGYEENAKGIRTFGIDRIQEIEVTPNEYISPLEVNFNPELFFKHCIGVSALNQQPEKIILEFTEFFGNYIKQQPIHNSQKIIEDTKEKLIVELELIVNIELQNIILSYGSQVKIIQPLSFKEKIKKELEEITLLY